MADTTLASSAPPKRRRWLRALVVVLGIFILFLVVAYFVGTSSAFFKGVILPKVSEALNATVTVSDASISPFHEVVLHDLKVQTTGNDPLVTAPEVRVRYSLTDIIGGNIHVDEVTLTSPTVVLVENPDGSSNLDPITKAQKEKPPQPQPPAKPSKPMQINLKKIALTDATVRQVKVGKKGSRDVTEISHLNFTVEDVKNGQSGKMTVAADIKMESNPAAPGTNGLLQAKLSGNFTFALSPDLKPASIQGNTRLEVARAEGALAQAAAFAANLDCDVTPTEIKQVALRFQKAGTQLAELRVSGPFDMEKTEGRLNIEILNIDKNLLNLAGAGGGLDFGPTTLNASNQVQLTKAGSAITASGQWNLNQLQVTRTNQTTPALDLRAAYDVTVDRTASNALLRVLTISGNQKGKELLHGELTSPMSFAWGNTSSAVGDSALNLSVTHLDLADWKPFLGDAASSGDVNVKLQLLSQQAGKQLSFDFNSQIDNLSAKAGSNQLSQISIAVQVTGKAADLKQFNLSNYQLQVARLNQPLVMMSGSGTYDQPTESADLQLNGQLMLARLLQALPQPNMSVSSGSADLKAHLTQKQKTQNISGSFALADFTGQVGSNSFRSFGTTADLDLGMTPRQVEIRKFSGKIAEGQNAGGAFDVSGTYDLTNKSAQLKAALVNFNQNGLRTFLEPSLGDKKLVSVALNANASVQYDPAGASSVKADLQVTNLVVNDPKGQVPATPLEARMNADASINKQIAEIRQFQVALTPTARATNQVQLSGRVDMSQTNAYQGNLKLVADSLDLTTYYDLFGAQKKGPEKAAAPGSPQPTPSTSPAAPGPEQEPEAKQLPFRNFVVEAAIRRLYLHEVEIADFQTTTKIDGGHVVLNPCKLALNNAPVNTTVDMDLGVPGYKYALDFNAQAVPLAPLVNTFQPERKGQIGGTFTATAKISGTGTTGANLQKNLNGQFDFGSTNLNLLVVNIHSPLLKTLINVVALIPDLVRNPSGNAASLLGALVPGKTGGLSADLEKSPIDRITARGTVGAGQMALQQALVQSTAFLAEANGTVTLATVLTNSAIQIPVTVSLSRSLADKFNLTPANAQTNLAYVALPNFLTMRGTVGQPKTDINKVALAGTVFKGIGGLIQGGGGKSGNLLQGVFGGGASGTTNQPSGNLGGVLGGLLGGNPPPATNASPGTATNQPTQSPVGNLLNQLFKQKK